MSTLLRLEEVSNKQKTWEECLPANLSDLFYYEDSDNKLKRYTNYFKLGDDAIAQIVALGASKIDCFRIIMGCEYDADDNQLKFAPVFSIVPVTGNATHYTLTYEPEIIETKLTFEGYIEITSSISSLFKQHWAELTDDQITNAFHGTTVNKIDFKYNKPVIKLTPENAFSNKRIRNYTIIHSDVEGIIKDLKSVSEEDRYIHVFLGAGLTVQLTHPFSFRPIIEVSSALAFPEDGSGPGSNYDRAKPCPPFCPNPGGG
ncbi:MAG: hypothetical protein AAF798_10615 [Bacteroidota bacterium]